MRISLTLFIAGAEWVPRGSLHAVLTDPDIILLVGDVLRMATDVARGMAYAHDRNVIHRDLKSHNLLVDEAFNLKVADFGFAKLLPSGQSAAYE